MRPPYPETAELQGMFWQGAGGPVAGRNGGGCTGCAARARGSASRRFGQAGANRIRAIDTSVRLLFSSSVEQLTFLDGDPASGR
jgi:hypothetical protein